MDVFSEGLHRKRGVLRVSKEMNRVFIVYLLFCIIYF